MKIIKRILAVLVLFLLIAATLTIFFIYNKKNNRITIISGNLIEFKESDKLFTSFLFEPILKMEKRYLKRNWITPKGIENSEKVPVGYCLREYEVGIGYENIRGLIEKYQDTACENAFEKLPDPIILSINSISSEVRGEYPREECDKWDMETKGNKMSRAYIYTQLRNDGRWNKISKNSKKILNSYIRIYCPLVEVGK